MKYILLSALLPATLLATFYSNAQSKRAKDTVINGQAFTYVEQMPEPLFNIQEYLGSSLHYPDTARKYNVQGRVIIKFIVTETGEIDSAYINKGIGGGCDEEALRVVRSMPRWRPGHQNGKAVRVYFTMPIVFKLED